MTGQLLYLVFPHNLHVFLKQCHQGTGIQLFLLLRSFALPAQAQTKAAGGLHLSHQLIHPVHPGLTLMNPCPDFLADGICQNIFKQLPILIVQQAGLLLHILLKLPDQFLKAHGNAAVFSLQIHPFAGRNACFFSFACLCKNKIKGQLIFQKSSAVLLIATLQLPRIIRRCFASKASGKHFHNLPRLILHILCYHKAALHIIQMVLFFKLPAGCVNCHTAALPLLFIFLQILPGTLPVRQKLCLSGCSSFPLLRNCSKACHTGIQNLPDFFIIGQLHLLTHCV